MPLPGSGSQIGMNQILQEKQGNSTARTNVSLKGLSVDGVDDSSGGDIAGTPDGNAPYAMSEFHGYSQSFWPASAGTITTNEDKILHAQVQDELGDDTTVCTVLHMTVNTSNNTLSWKLQTDINNANERDFSGTTSLDATFNTNTNTISYNGTLSSLEARMVITDMDILRAGGGNSFSSASFAGRVWAAHSSSEHLDGSSISNNGDTGLNSTQKQKLSGTDSTNDLQNQDVTYGYKTMRTTSGDCSIGLFATNEDVGSTTGNFSDGVARFNNSGAGVSWQIRANGTEVLTVFAHTYNASENNGNGRRLTASTVREATT